MFCRALCDNVQCLLLKESTVQLKALVWLQQHEYKNIDMEPSGFSSVLYRKVAMLYYQIEKPF